MCIYLSMPALGNQPNIGEIFVNYLPNINREGCRFPGLFSGNGHFLPEKQKMVISVFLYRFKIKIRKAFVGNDKK